MNSKPPQQTAAPPVEPSAEEKSAPKGIQLLRGMKDILPEDAPYWDQVTDTVRSIAAAYGFQRIETPVLEETNLFIRSVGKETDIVEKEMFSFADQSGDNVSLRPENTAGVARAYLEHGMVSLPQPVKLFYLGPFFRHNRPQAGRYRQFFQIGFEVIGEAHPIIDAQLILLAYALYRDLDLSISLQVNSVGHPDCRREYEKALVDFYRTRKNELCEDCKRRLQRNPLRLLDCKVEHCRELAADAPQIVDYLCDADRQHFMQLLEYLDSLELPYTLNPRIVRGLDYYSRTAFEIWPQEGEPGSQQELGGGGRYDYLIETLGGRPTPAAGFACGIERTVLLLKERQQAPPSPKQLDVFIAQLGDQARKKCLKLFEELRREGFSVGESLSKSGIKQQLEIANRRRARYAMILGQKELVDGTILLRDMENGIQEVVDFQKTALELRKRLERQKPNGLIPPPA